MSSRCQHVETLHVLAMVVWHFWLSRNAPGSQFLVLDSTAMAAKPAFDCSKVKDSSVEKMICGDEQLAQLDRTLAKVYAAAAKKAVNEHPPVLKAEQRGWIKGRGDADFLNYLNTWSRLYQEN